jgi:hypothetical protein
MKAVVLAVALSSACTLGPGRGFATLDAVELDARFEPGAARDVDGAVLTDLGYLVELDSFELEIDRFELQTLADSGESLRFDEANPPQGYDLCHGGHCHAEDGSLVPYEEIEAELAGGVAAFSTLATLPVERVVDLREGEGLRLSRVEPSRELPEGHVRRAALHFTRVTLSGRVSEGGLETPLPLTVSLNVDARTTGALDLPIDRDAPGRFLLQAELAFDGTLLDGIDFVNTAESVDIDDPDDERAARLIDALTDTAFELTIVESENE